MCGCLSCTVAQLQHICSCKSHLLPKPIITSSLIYGATQLQHVGKVDRACHCDADVDEQSKREIKDVLMQYDRTLLVADPRRCEPKKYASSNKADDICLCACSLHVYMLHHAQSGYACHCLMCKLPAVTHIQQLEVLHHVIKILQQQQQRQY